MKLFYISRSRAEELPMLERLKKYGKIDLSHVDIASGNSYQKLKTILVIFQLAITRRPDVVLSEGAGLVALFSLVVSKICRSQLAFRVKSDPYLEFGVNMGKETIPRKLYRSLNFLAFRISLRHCQMVLPISSVIKTTLQENMPIEKPIFTIHIPARKISYEKDTPKGPGDDFVITVSNFQFRRKVEPLLKAIPPISRILKRLEIAWYILGDGRYFKDIKKAIHNAGAHSTIKITGKVNPVSYYQKAQAHFYFSGMDAAPNALLESFYFQVPVLVNDELPAKDIAIEGFNVVTMKGYDDDEVTKSIKTILYNTAVRQQVIDNSQKMLSEQFSVESISEKLWSALSELEGTLKN